MIILALETSCDETAAALVMDGRTVLSSVVHSQIPEHEKYGGVVPEIASRSHTEHILPVTRRALSDAGLTMEEVDAIAVTAAPGLIGALLVGVGFAKGLALATQKPLIPVHHIRGHVASCYLACPDLEPPFLCLVASGGHSHIIHVEDYTTMRVLGRTRDDAAGEAFDKAARAMGLPYPGGVHLDRAARTGDPTRYSLPTPKVEGAALDMSFSGLKTAVLNLINTAGQRGEAIHLPDLAAAFEERVAHALCHRLLLAAEQTGLSTIAAAGGVSANTGLRQMLTEAARSRGLTLCLPPLSLCGDNAAMIGAQGYYEYQAGVRAGSDLNARASLSVERALAADFSL
jgi:N6-L-threonylcarbamoyladenine synthase